MATLWRHSGEMWRPCGDPALPQLPCHLCCSLPLLLLLLLLPLLLCHSALLPYHCCCPTTAALPPYPLCYFCCSPTAALPCDAVLFRSAACCCVFLTLTRKSLRCNSIWVCGGGDAKLLRRPCHCCPATPPHCPATAALPLPPCHSALLPCHCCPCHPTPHCCCHATPPCCPATAALPLLPCHCHPALLSNY